MSNGATDLRPNSEIGDGIHWLSNMGVNYYIVEKDNDELVLIDTGMNKKSKGIMRYIKQELSDMTPSHIFLTHHHLDHMGGLHHLDKHFHPRKFAHPTDVEVISGERSSPLGSNIFVKPFMWVMLKLMAPKRVQGIELVEDGQKEQGFQVYHLPGHTMGSVGFVQGQTMFSGDAAVTDNGTIKIGPKIVAEDLDAVYHSIRKMGKIEFNQILPGHGDPILEDADMRIQDAIERYEL